jgi:hypothetical protein
VHDGSGAVDSTNNVCHTGLVAHEGSKVARLGGIILESGRRGT